MRVNELIKIVQCTRLFFFLFIILSTFKRGVSAMFPQMRLCEQQNVLTPGDNAFFARSAHYSYQFYYSQRFAVNYTRRNRNYQCTYAYRTVQRTPEKVVSH